MTSLGPGAVLEGKYRIQRLIGSGGMGVVYAAERVTLGDVVALKCILEEKNTEANRGRFLREAQAAARIRHPNVVQVFDFGTPQGGRPYMVMEYLEGPTLAEELRRVGRMDRERALWIFGKICAAVEAGHRRGVVHRDVKPGNVILARSDDGREAVKVLDFGLARLVDDGSSDVTNPGLVVGTVSYMAPEQIAGGQVSPATDVFSLAVVLYEMFTGHLPFAEDNQVATLFRISQGNFDPPRQHAPELAAEIEAALEAGLSVDSHQRPRSPLRLAEMAGVVLGEGQRDRDRSTTTELPVLSPDSEDSVRSSGGTRANVSVEGLTLVDAAPRSELRDDVFVGRSDPLDALRRELEAASQGAGKIVLVLGEAGIGKSRLVDELSARLSDSEVRVLRGRFFAYEGDHPPPCEALRWMLHAGDSHRSGRVAMAPMGPAAAPSGDKWTVFAELAQQFVHKAEGAPLLLAIDDLQWATDLDLEFLAYLPHAARPHPVMIIGTARPDAEGELARWQATLSRQRALRTVHLPPLTTNELRAWLSAFFGRIRIRPRDVRRIHHATAGNPFAMVEVVRQLVDRGKIERHDDGWACEDLYDVAIPETVHALYEARLESLAAEERQVLDLACVVGEQFRFETLQQAGGFDEVDLERSLVAAVSRRVLTDRDLAPGADYRFTSEGIRQVLYDGLPPRARKRQHQKVVGALRALYADGDAQRIAHVLAYHHHAVGDWEPALEHALVATRSHLESHAHDSAETCAALAVSAADEIEKGGAPLSARTRARLSFVQGTLHTRIGRLEEGQAELTLAVANAEEATDASLALDAMLALTEGLLGRGHFADGVAQGMQAIGAAQSLGDRRREYVARVSVARCATPLGRLDDAESILTPVLAERDGSLAAVRSFALREAALVAAKRGAFGAARSAAEQAQEQARAASDALAEYRATSALGFVHAECGQLDEAQQHLQSALELARALSLRRREGIELCNLGETLHLVGDSVSGLELVRNGLTIFVEIGDKASEGDCRVNIGRMLMALGRKREGVDMLEAGRRACSASGRGEYEGLALCGLGQARLEDNDAADARALFEEARDVMAAAGAAHRWQAELGLARTAIALGQPEVGRRHAMRGLKVVEDQLAALPADATSRGLNTARQEILRFVSDDAPTQSIPITGPTTGRST